MKLYLNLWSSAYTPDWHCHSVETDKEIAELEFKINSKRNPNLLRHLVETDVPYEIDNTGKLVCLVDSNAREDIETERKLGSTNIAAESNEGGIVEAIYSDEEEPLGLPQFVDPEILADADD